MRVSEERIEELRRLYKDAHGKDLSREEARDMALRLVDLYRLLMRPLPGDKKPRAQPTSKPLHRNEIFGALGN
jgi:hypothetical protein